MKLSHISRRARKAARLTPVFTLIVVIFATSSQAQLQVDITSGTVEPLPIAIPEFFGKTNGEAETGRKIADLISADLERSGLFRPIDRRAFIQRVSTLQVQPRFSDWRQINAQALVSGSTQSQPDGRLKVDSAFGMCSAVRR